MSNQSEKIESLSSLKDHIASKKKTNLIVAYQNLEGYEGMVLCIMLVIDIDVNKYNLDLQWMSFGLDPYGDTLQESCIYEFTSLESILDYLEKQYQINVTDIQIPFKFNPKDFPNTIDFPEKKPEYQEAWKQFQLDFRKGVFLNQSLKLIESTHTV